MPLIALCESGARDGVFPGASFAVGTAREALSGQAGRFSWEADSPKVSEGTLYDIASLTKVVAATAAAMIAFDEGLLELERSVHSMLPGFKGPGKDRITVRDLLLHDSGLPAYGNYEEPCSSVHEVREAILREPLECETGTKTLYSCLNAVLLQLCIEALVQMHLDCFVKDRIFDPLGMSDTLFNPPPSMHGRIAPTTKAEAWRAKFCPDAPNEGEWIRGQVHDPIAFMLGGVSGNAGLFSTASDLAKFAQLMLGKGVRNGKRLIDETTVDCWTRRQSDQSSRALAWDTRSEEGSSAGSSFSTRSYGHTGYTGTSLWIDPENGWFAVLLTNRIHPNGDNDKITAFRPMFHDAAAEVLAAQ